MAGSFSSHAEDHQTCPSQAREPERAGPLPTKWDRASDFESTGLSSNCTGGIRSRGSMADSGRSNHASVCIWAPTIPRDFRGTDGGRWTDKLLILLCFWWAHKGSNLGPLPCEGNALPLSYAPGNLRALSKAWKGGQGKEHGSNQSPRFTKPTPPVSRQIPGGKPLKCCSGPLLSGSGGVRLQRPDALG